MFRFSIRELLLLTLIVAIGVGWTLRERQLKAQVAAQTAMNDVWERRAEAMVGGLESCGCKVAWDDRRIKVSRSSPNPGHTWTISIATRP
jgi:hypothetical protein